MLHLCRGLTVSLYFWWYSCIFAVLYFYVLDNCHIFGIWSFVFCWGRTVVQLHLIAMRWVWQRAGQNLFQQMQQIGNLQTHWLLFIIHFNRLKTCKTLSIDCYLLLFIVIYFYGCNRLKSCKTLHWLLFFRWIVGTHGFESFGRNTTGGWQIALLCLLYLSVDTNK